MDPFGTTKHHLDRTDDPTLLILRAHLLVEERLRDVLARICRSSEQVPAARLSFHQSPWRTRPRVIRPVEHWSQLPYRGDRS